MRGRPACGRAAITRKQRGSAPDSRTAPSTAPRNLPKGDPTRWGSASAHRRAGDPLQARRARSRRDDSQRRVGRILRDARGFRANHRKRFAAMQERARVLERQARRRRKRRWASTFDAHAVDTYLYLTCAKAEAARMVQREKGRVPGGYNHPARLARVLSRKRTSRRGGGRFDRAPTKMDSRPAPGGNLGLQGEDPSAQGKSTRVSREQSRCPSFRRRSASRTRKRACRAGARHPPHAKYVVVPPLVA